MQTNGRIKKKLKKKNRIVAANEDSNKTDILLIG